jgi:hypothetical protein
MRANNIRPLTGNKKALIDRIEFFKSRNFGIEDNISDFHIKTSPVYIQKGRTKSQMEKSYYEKMTIPELKQILRAYMLKLSGRKQELIGRIEMHTGRKEPEKLSKMPKMSNVGPQLEDIEKMVPEEVYNPNKRLVKNIRNPKQEVLYFPIEETEIDTSPKSKGIVINRPKVIKNLPHNPQDIVSKLQRDLDELQSLNNERSMLYGDKKYHGNTRLIDIAFMAVLEKHKNVAFIIDIKYKGKYDTSMAPSRFGFEIAIPRNLKSDDLKIDYKQLGIQLQYYSDHDIICVPFNFLERFGAGHANMLIYRPKLGIVEHFEPHGFNYVDGSDPIDKYIKRCMINLWEKQLTPWVGSVKYISTDMICPSYMGLQNISGDMGCLMWSLFAADVALSNPDIRLSTLIPTILDISKNDKKYVRNIITGYMVRIEQMLSTILNQEVNHDVAAFFKLSGRYEAGHGKVNTIIKSNPKIYK